MSLNIPPFPDDNVEPDAIRLAIANRDEATRQLIAERKAARLAGNAPAKKAKRRRNRSIKGGQMDAHVYLIAFEVEK